MLAKPNLPLRSSPAASKRFNAKKFIESYTITITVTVTINIITTIIILYCRSKPFI